MNWFEKKMTGVKVGIGGGGWDGGGEHPEMAAF